MKFDSKITVRGKEVETWRAPSRSGAICLGFNPESNIYKCLERFAEEGFKGPKLLLDLSFPGNAPLKFDGWETIKIKNQGTAKNWDIGWKLLKCPEKLVGVEPDEFGPHGWVKAALRVLDDPSVSIATLTMSTHHPKFIEHFGLSSKFINGIECVEFPLGSPTPWPMSAMSHRILKHGLDAYDFYGALEPLTQQKVYKMGQRVVHLKEYSVEHLRGTNEYEEWKRSSGDKETKETFKEWLQTRVKA
jgi:hypothetical protein